MNTEAEKEKYRVCWADLGRVDYERSLELQTLVKSRVREDGSPGYVLYLEHPPTITLGYSLKGDEGRSSIRSDSATLAASGIRVVEVDRGGKATYHGPGQLICYPILSLKELRLGVKRYVGKLLEVALRSLSGLGAEVRLDDDYPGVWSGNAKLAAVGIRIEDRVSSHGLAVNIEPDLAGFSHIVPCGIADRPVTSLSALGVRVDRDRVIEAMNRELDREFGVELRKVEPDEVPGFNHQQGVGFR